MKKQFLLFSITAMLIIFFASCNKENLGQYEDYSVAILAKSPDFITTTMVSGSSEIIGEYDLTVPAVDSFTANFGVRIDGTLGITNMSNIFIVFKVPGDTSTVYKTEIKSIPSTSNPGWFYFNWSPVINGVSKFPAGKYKGTIMGTAKAGKRGSLRASMDMEYKWAGKSATIVGPFSGQTITVMPYSTYPVITQVSIDDRIDTSVVKQFNKVHVEVIGGDTCTFPQFAFAINFASTSSDTGVKQLAFWKGNADITNRGKFYNGAGVQVTFLRKSDMIVYFVLTEGGAEDTSVTAADYAIGGKSCTFGPMGTTFLGSKNVPAGWNFLNRGLSGGNLKLYSGIVPSGSAFAAGTIFSWFKKPHYAIVEFNKGDFAAVEDELTEQLMYRH